MTRNIKQIAHDLAPLSDMVTELSEIVSQLLGAIEPHASFDDTKAEKYFQECTIASEKMSISSGLIQRYIQEIKSEADLSGSTQE